MNPLNKNEVIGIFWSVVIMAIALTFIRFKTDVFTMVTSVDDNNNIAAVVATRELSNEEKGLERNLIDGTDASGTLVKLVIEDIRLGNGGMVQDGDTVVVNYIGATQDGVRFDSSYERGESFIFTVGAGTVIKGWDNGLVGMRIGGQRMLVIPSDMAYGNMEVGIIPPNSTLVFAIELLEIR